MVHKMVTIKVYGLGDQEDDMTDPDTGKPFLRCELGDGRVFDVSLNLGEMIGAAAVGVRQRFEETATKASKARTN